MLDKTARVPGPVLETAIKKLQDSLGEENTNYLISYLQKEGLSFAATTDYPLSAVDDALRKVFNTGADPILFYIAHFIDEEISKEK